MTERPKVHDWKSCVVKATVGSNPTLSAIVKMRSLFRESFKVSASPVMKKRMGENPRGFDSKIPLDVSRRRRQR